MTAVISMKMNALVNPVSMVVSATIESVTTNVIAQGDMLGQTARLKYHPVTNTTLFMATSTVNTMGDAISMRLMCQSVFALIIIMD